MTTLLIYAGLLAIGFVGGWIAKGKLGAQAAADLATVKDAAHKL